MSVQTLTEPERDLGILIAKDEITISALAEAIDGLRPFRKRCARPTYLIDLRSASLAASHFDLDTFAVRYSRMPGGWPADVRVAVAVRAGNDMDLVRRFRSQSDATAHNFGIFSRMRDALEWLDLPRDDTPVDATWIDAA